MTSIHPESEFNLKVEQIIESENKKGPVAKILCSVRTIVVLFLVLSVATLLIIITLFSAASISSVVQLSSSSRSVATRSVQALLTEKMRLPQTLAYQLITPLTMNSLSLSDNELVECLGALYSVAYQTTQIMKGTELRFSLWDANNDNYASITASSMDLISNASMFYHWRGYSSDISRANVQFVNNLPTLNNFNPNQFVSQILWNNTRDSYRDYRKGFATWIPARLSDECSIGEDHCSTVIGYMVPKTILNGTDEILIYATFDYAVSDISSALADLKGKYKSVYIVEKQTGNLIASNDESEMLVRYTNGIPEMIRAEDSKNELTSESIHAIRRKFGSSLQKLGESNGKMQEGSLKYQVSSGVAFCDIIYFSAGPGMEWVIVISTLQASTLRKYIALIVTAEVISVLMGLLTIIIGIFMLKTVGGALKQLQKDSSLLVKMKLERFQNSTISSLTEFSTIQTSLMQVVNRLMEYKAFLPNAVILRDFGSAEVHGVDPIDWSTDEQEIQQSDEANIEIPTSPSDTKFNIGIEPSISSVLYLQIVNLDNLIANKSMPDFVLLHSKMMKIVELSVKRCRGVLVDFTESKAVVHWSNMRIGPKLCCQCALLIQQELNWMKELHVVISVVTSDGYYGTLGTRTRKQFTAFGKSRHASKSITKINALQFKVPILICETTKNSCDSLVVRPISSVKFDKYRTTVYELLSDVSNDSEFMFEMDPEKQSYNQYTEAYELLQQGKIKAAQEKLKHFVEDCPDDLPGRKLFDLVESLPHFDMSQKVSPVYTLESISKRNIEW